MPGWTACARSLQPPPATESPYASDAEMIPTNLPDALTALQDDGALVEGFGADFVRYYRRVKLSEAQRHAAAEDPTDFERREYFSRF
jgi:glutamine synthetase